ncbi:hypothetical protein ACFX2I_017279 [Malus domestica]
MGLDHYFTHEFSASHALQLFEEMSHSCGLCNGDSFVLVLQFGYHKGIRDKDGTVCLSKFNSKDFLAICELGFVLNAKKRIFFGGS